MQTGPELCVMEISALQCVSMFALAFLRSTHRKKRNVTQNPTQKCIVIDKRSIKKPLALLCCVFMQSITFSCAEALCLKKTIENSRSNRLSTEFYQAIMFIFTVHWLQSIAELRNNWQAITYSKISKYIIESNGQINKQDSGIFSLLTVRLQAVYSKCQYHLRLCPLRLEKHITIGQTQVEFLCKNRLPHQVQVRIYSGSQMNKYNTNLSKYYTIPYYSTILYNFFFS